MEVPREAGAARDKGREALFETMRRTESFYTDDGRVFNLVTGEYEQRDIDPRNAGLTILRQGDAPVFDSINLS